MTAPRSVQPSPAQLTYTNFDQVTTEIRQIYRLFQPKAHRVFKTAPIAADLTEGEIVLFDDESSSRKVYTKINGTLRYATLT